MGELSLWHWLVVAIVMILLFGSQKLPALARGTGQALRIFRAEMRGDSSSSAEGSKPDESDR